MQIVEITEMSRGRIRICLENGTIFPLYRKEAAVFNISEGAELEVTVWDEICKTILQKRARKRAMYLLQKMDRTEKQLREKLVQSEYPEEIVEDAIDYVRSYHYIDDVRYAENYVHCHQDTKSKMQIKIALTQKGVEREVIDHALEECLETDAEQLICRLLEKKRYNAETADEGERRRVYQYLARRGFRSSEILHCMNQM